MYSSKTSLGSVGDWIMQPKNHAPASDSRNKFRDLARDLEANEDETAFEETLKRIAPKGPVMPKAD